MVATSELARVTAIVLRFMRTPIIVLVTVYAVALVGMVLMPGRDAAGNPSHMSFFHAFYFLTYSATTTGFGELPYPFTDAQRLWAIIVLYTSIPAWLYAFAAIVRLVRNPHFVQAVAHRRFAHSVRRIADEFFLICGFGNTGSLLTRGLNDAGRAAVIIDRDEERIKALALRDYRRTMPGLFADATAPRHLLAAGVKRSSCEAVVALTNSEDVNVKIAIMARLLNRSTRVVCLASSPERSQCLQAIGGIEVIDPFDAFAKWLATALFAPSLHTLTLWLFGARGVTLDKPLSVPVGTWILCGYGRMGRRLREVLQARGVRTVIIDPDMEGAGKVPAGEKVLGHADANSLRQAGIEQAVGVVAATDDDIDNLEILLTARALNPRAYVIVRQNHHENGLAFDAAKADLIMQPSLVTARNVLLQLISPSAQTFLEYLRAHHDRLLAEVVKRLRTALGSHPPRLWTSTISQEQAAAVVASHGRGERVTLGDILRDPLRRERRVGCVPLVVERAGEESVLPELTTKLEPEDKVLFCGTRYAERQIRATLNNEYTLQYLSTGAQEPRGYIMQWFARRFLPERPATLQG